MSPPLKWIPIKSNRRNSAQSNCSTLSKFRLERWITAEFAEMEPGTLSLIDVKYINAFLEERFTQMLIECDLASRAIHKLIDSVQACYLEDGTAGVEQWVEIWLVRIVNEALFWIERGCLLRRAASLLLAGLDELLELHRFSWGLGPLAVINQARRVRQVLDPEGIYADEYLPSLGSVETGSILDPSLELDLALDCGASHSGGTELSELVDDACGEMVVVVVREKRWKRWKKALSL